MKEGVAPPSRSALLAAFAAVYLVWGSTYLAIRFAIETLPPLSMSGLRFLVAGALLLGLGRWKGGAWPSSRQVGVASAIGVLLFLGGNGGVVWAEQWVTSSLAALLVSILPFWVVLWDWLRPGGERPSLAVTLGVVVGFAGVALLVDPFSANGHAEIDPVGAVALVGATLSWAAGSLWSRDGSGPASPWISTAVQMLAGGASMLLAGAVLGEFGRFDPAAVSVKSLAAWAYLTIFGAVVAFSAYAWLLRVAPTAQVSTYAYVNPVVAMVLGWALAGEPLTSRTLLAAGIILGAVAVITTVKARRAPARR